MRAPSQSNNCESSHWRTQLQWGLAFGCQAVSAGRWEPISPISTVIGLLCMSAPQSGRWGLPSAESLQMTQLLPAPPS